MIKLETKNMKECDKTDILLCSTTSSIHSKRPPNNFLTLSLPVKASH